MHASTHPLTPLPLPLSQATLGEAGPSAAPPTDTVALGVPSQSTASPHSGWFGGVFGSPALPAPAPAPPLPAQMHPALCQAAQRDPHMLLCAQSQQLMEDPVLAPDGFTYERSILQLCIEYHGFYSPVTKHPFPGHAKDPNFLRPNYNIKRATEALQTWRTDRSGDDIRNLLRPALTDPTGQHHLMRVPMTLSDGTTVDASQLPSLFEQHPLRSPFTQQLWQRYQEEARCNRALQALASAVLGFELPDFPAHTTFPTWADPQLQLPPPSSRLAYRSFCWDYRGITYPIGMPVGCLGGMIAGLSSGIAATGLALGWGVCLGTCFGTLVLTRGVDYPLYRTAQKEAALLFDKKTADAYHTFNAQRMAVDLPPVQPPMQRWNSPP